MIEEGFVLPILFGLILVIAHYISQRLNIQHDAHRMKIISFTAGIFITYLILHMLPQLYVNNLFLNRISLLSVLIGFSFFHTIEKYIYQHESGDRLKMDLKSVHEFLLFLYYVVVGIVLVSITQLNIVNGILLFIPILLFTALSTVSLKQVHEIMTSKKITKTVLSISALFGALIGIFLDINIVIYDALFGFVVGSMLYVIVVESLPKEREGNPLFFILGLVLYTIIISFTWLV